MQKFRHRMLIGAVLFALFATACGGGDADESTTTAAGSPTTSEAGDTTSPPAGETTTTEASTEAPSNPGAANKATVVIDGETYEFDVEMSVVGRCEADFFGAFWVIASAADGSNSSMEMFIVPEGDTTHNETPRLNVNLQDAEGRDWYADADGGNGVGEGLSQIDSFEIDGNTVSGTATFVDTYAGDGATAQGTFTATCP